MIKETLDTVKKKIKNLTIRQFLKNKAKNRLNIEARLTQREQIVLRIVKQAMADRKNILLNAPISGKYYIKTPDDEMFIIISDSNVVVCNHKFYYDIDINHKLSELLIDRFTRILDHQRHLMEREMLGNIVDGLSSISEKIEIQLKSYKNEN